MTSKGKARVAVVGATGLAGQQFLVALANHPQFQVTHLAASERSAGKSYKDAITTDGGHVGWYANEPMPSWAKNLTVLDAKALDASTLDLVFSCVESAPARELEPLYAKHCPVISTASAYRKEEDVPLLIPGVNMDHISLLAQQSQAREWKGWIAPNPNCTTVGLAVTLAPIYREFGIKQVHMTSMQAVSGAGRSPGVIALDVVDNLVPFIPGEEAKVQSETQKILGSLSDGGIQPAQFPISCTCTRIGVLEGHTEVVHVELEKDATVEEIKNCWAALGEDFCKQGYPSCPETLIYAHEDPFRPQVRLDRNMGDGMTTVVGRLRKDENSPRGWQFILVSHNTKMGAAKGCVLLAEHLAAQGVLTW